jgi:hypothetical protein
MSLKVVNTFFKPGYSYKLVDGSDVVCESVSENGRIAVVNMGGVRWHVDAITGWAPDVSDAPAVDMSIEGNPF